MQVMDHASCQTKKERSKQVCIMGFPSVAICVISCAYVHYHKLDMM